MQGYILYKYKRRMAEQLNAQYESASQNMR